MAADLNLRLPYDDGTFDVVCSNQVIEHLSDTDTFVAELHRVLRPGGFAVTSTENLASWHNVASLTLGWQPFSLTNVSRQGLGLGNPLAIHRAEGWFEVETWQHLRVFAYRAGGALRGAQLRRQTSRARVTTPFRDVLLASIRGTQPFSPSSRGSRCSRTALAGSEKEIRIARPCPVAVDARPHRLREEWVTPEDPFGRVEIQHLRDLPGPPARLEPADLESGPRRKAGQPLARVVTMADEPPGRIGELRERSVMRRRQIEHAIGPEDAVELGEHTLLGVGRRVLRDLPADDRVE